MISQFASISTGTGDTSYPQPASTFVGALGVTNFDLLGFVPLGCVVRGASFYDKVLFKTSAPVLAITLLSCYPVANALRGKPTDAATRTVKRLSLILLELTLPSITTSLVQVRCCLVQCAVKTDFTSGSILLGAIC